MESANPDLLFTSVLSVGEIRKGIELLPASKKRRNLEQWLDSDLYGWFGSNLLPVTKAISDRWGVFAARSQGAGQAARKHDGVLGGDRLRAGLTVATHNTKHFEGLGVAILDPWETDRIVAGVAGSIPSPAPCFNSLREIANLPGRA